MHRLPLYERWAAISLLSQGTTIENNAQLAYNAYGSWRCRTVVDMVKTVVGKRLGIGGGCIVLRHPRSGDFSPVKKSITYFCQQLLPAQPSITTFYYMVGKSATIYRENSITHRE